jgi:D-3-phosphoglycerate dehydrogenase / 2-oxoglutarate reductase
MTTTAVRIVITECDHDSFVPEHDLTDNWMSAGAELVLTQSRTAVELVANSSSTRRSPPR